MHTCMINMKIELNIFYIYITMNLEIDLEIDF